MQPTATQVNTNEVIKTESSQWITSLPSELVNIIPENVWISLTLDQKKDVLRQHGLFEKYAGNGDTNSNEQTASKVMVESNNDVIVSQEQKSEMNPEFQKVVEDFKRENKETKEDEKPVLTKDEISRIEEEKASNANTGGSTYQFFGYQPSQNIYTNSTNISQSGDVADAKTWAATLIQRIFSMFGR